MGRRGKGCTDTATIPVGEIPTRVAVNPKANTIYVTNLASNTVSVLSGRTNTVTATIPVGIGPVGVDPKTNTIYVANPDSNTVSVISGRTHTVTATIHFPVSIGPVGVAAD